MLKDVSVAFLAAVLALVGWGIRERSERSRRLKKTKAALAVEIASLVALIRHQNYAGEVRAHAAAIRAAGQEFGYPIVCIPITHSYFSVFEANANLVGELETNEVVRVISFYQQARSLADSLSKAGTPDNTITPVAEAASRYEALASAVDSLCDLGVAVTNELASQVVLDQIADVARQLRPTE
jgi:hypothetical protein